jgi:hypothetical protein
MALSVEGSILRNANAHRPFTGGLFLGRHVNGDIYRVVPPAEAIATQVANGAIRSHGNLDTEIALAKLFSRHQITGWRRQVRLEVAREPVLKNLGGDATTAPSLPKQALPPRRHPVILISSDGEITHYAQIHEPHQGAGG